MPLGSLSTDLVRKNSMGKRANFQDTRDFIRSHLMISQVQHQNSYSKNATNVAFFLLTSLPTELPVSHVPIWISSTHPTPKGITSRLRMLLLLYHHKSIFTVWCMVFLGRQQIQNFSQYFKIIHVRGSQQHYFLWFQRSIGDKYISKYFRT